MDKYQNIHPTQAPEWAEFRRRWGNEILESKYGLITLHKIPFTNFKIGMFIKGPEPAQAMLTDLKMALKENKLIFLKVEPNVPETVNGKLFPKSKSIISLLKKNGAIRGKNLFTSGTFWLDLKKTEEELLKTFSSKTRYNIKIAQKHGVEVKIDNSKEAFDAYLKLTQETVQRQGFYAHSARYHKLMWEVLHDEMVNSGKESIANLLIGRYQAEIISAWILLVYDNFLYYPYGASTDKYKNVMANNLMMWEAIKFGKSKGLDTFDFWGREENKGYTKFKEGYSPVVVEFIGSWDLTTNKLLYWMYRIAEDIRWRVLRLKSSLGLFKQRF